MGRLSLSICTIGLCVVLAADAGGAVCGGDCDDNGKISIGELIIGVRIALGTSAVEDCASFDTNDDGRVAIGELIAAVRSALSGCPDPLLEFPPGLCRESSADGGLAACPAQREIEFRCCRSLSCEIRPVVNGCPGAGGCRVTSEGMFPVMVDPGDSECPRVIGEDTVTGNRAVVSVPDAVPGNFVAAIQGVVAAPQIIIDPLSEATTRLLEQNGFENYADESIVDIDEAVRDANQNTVFPADPDGAADLATMVAADDSMVQEILRTARMEPTSSPTVTPGQSDFTPTPTPTVVVSPTATFTPPTPSLEWVAEGDGDWSEPSNWDKGRTPGPNDVVGINAPGRVVTFPSGSSTVRALHVVGDFVIGGGTLTVNRSSVIDGALTIACGATLAANGNTTVFSALGPTTINGASLRADGGALIELPDVSEYRRPCRVNATLSARGRGRIELSQLPSVNWGHGYTLTITAESGGQVLMPMVQGFGGGGAFRISASGAGSLVDLSEIEALIGATRDNTSMSVSNGGEIRNPSQNTIHGATLNLSPDSVFTTTELTSFTNSRLRADMAVDFGNVTDVSFSDLTVLAGGSLDIGKVTNIDSASFLVRGAGAVLTVPATSYQRSVRSNASFHAEGGGVLDLSALSSLSWGHDYTLTIIAESGGQVLMPMVQGFGGGGAFRISASGAGSLVDLSEIEALIGATRDNTSMSVSNGGEIRNPSQNTIHGATLNLSPDSVFTTTELTSFTNSRLRADMAVDFGNVTDVSFSDLTVLAGGSLDIGKVTNIDSASFLVRGAGAVLTVPATSYQRSVGSNASFHAEGGGVLDLSALSSLSWGHDYTLTIIAESGGQVLMPMVQGFGGGGAFRISASGAGSLVDLSEIEALIGATRDNTSMSVSNGGEIRNPSQNTIHGATLNLSPDSVFTTTELTSFTNSRLRADTAVDFGNVTDASFSDLTVLAGGSLDIGKVTNIDSASFLVRGAGAVLTVPATSYQRSVGSNASFHAEGGGVLDLSALNSLNWSGHTLTIVALGAGKVNLSGLAAITGGGVVNITATGPSSEIDLSMAHSFDPAVTLLEEFGGSILVPPSP